MTTLNDQQIIDNTRITPQEDHVKMMITLPDGEEYSQMAKDADSAKKHIIAWCDSVRSYIKQKEADRLEELAAARKRRGTEHPVTAPERPVEETSPESGTSPQQLVISHYKHLQEEIDRLGIEVEEKKKKRNSLRDERDKLKPVMEIWGVTE